MSTGTQVEVVMPQMGVSVSEGTVTRWLKQPGETIALDEPLLEISTDKVDTEVPSPGEGVVAEIRVQEGETVEVGTVLAVIAPEGAAVAETPAAEPEAPAQDASAAAPGRGEASSDTVSQAPAPPVQPGPHPPSRRARPRSRYLCSPRPTQSRRLRSREATGRRSSLRSSRASRRSTASTRARSPGPDRAAGSRRRTSSRTSSPVPSRGPARRAPCPARCPEARARRGRGGSAGALLRPTPRLHRLPPPPRHRPPRAQPRGAGDSPSRERRRAAEPMNAMRRGIAEHMRRSLDTSAPRHERDRGRHRRRSSRAREALKKEYQANTASTRRTSPSSRRRRSRRSHDWPWSTARSAARDR